MRWYKNYLLLTTCTLLLAIILRWPGLDIRPLHGDEAVNAVKFGTLLERGTYIYDPFEYHGPTLYFSTLVSSWIYSIESFSDLTEFSLRIITVMFGLFTILIFIPLSKYISRSVLLISLLFLAISPVCVYYNRYYIHETLLVFFVVATQISGYLYLKKRTWQMALLTGVFLGLMIATKETWVIFVFAMLIALSVTGKFKPAINSLNYRHLSLVAAGAFLIFVMFYSSFFQNPQGIVDAFISYKNYIFRAGGNEIHSHPWYYYLSLLLFFKNGPFPFWTEALILIFALIGMVFILSGRTGDQGDKSLFRFSAIYTIVLIIIFSAIPYKTPWNLLGFMPGFVLLAALGIIQLYRFITHTGIRYLYIFLLMIAAVHLVWQTYELNFTYPANPANPYVYAHPLPDIFYMAEQTDKIVETHPQKNNLHIQVIAPDNDYWPFPWYFRKYNHVGWWNHIPSAENIAPIVILNSSLEKELIKKLYTEKKPGYRDLYLPLFDRDTYLRPGIEFRGYIKKDDWDLANQASVDTLLN